MLELYMDSIVPISEISVFFPTYNEEKNIKSTVLNASMVLKKLFKSWEIIIVNDGSNDGTKDIAEGLAIIDSRIRVINHNQNK